MRRNGKRLVTSVVVVVVAVFVAGSFAANLGVVRNLLDPLLNQRTSRPACRRDDPEPLAAPGCPQGPAPEPLPTLGAADASMTLVGEYRSCDGADPVAGGDRDALPAQLADQEPEQLRGLVATTACLSDRKQIDDLQPGASTARLQGVPLGSHPLKGPRAVAPRPTGVRCPVRLHGALVDEHCCSPGARTSSVRRPRGARGAGSSTRSHDRRRTWPYPSSAT